MILTYDDVGNAQEGILAPQQACRRQYNTLRPFELLYLHRMGLMLISLFRTNKN